MSVRYTATWYDVTQARQQETHHTHRHVPARPAGILSSQEHHHTHSWGEDGGDEGGLGIGGWVTSPPSQN